MGILEQLLFDTYGILCVKFIAIAACVQLLKLHNPLDINLTFQRRFKLYYFIFLLLSSCNYIKNY